MKKRKLKKIEVYPQFILDLFLFNNIHWKIIEGKLPEGTEVVSAGYDITKNCFVLILESEEFEEIDEGWTIPFQPIPRHEIICEVLKTKKNK